MEFVFLVSLIGLGEFNKWEDKFRKEECGGGRGEKRLLNLLCLIFYNDRSRIFFLLILIFLMYKI